MMQLRIFLRGFVIVTLTAWNVRHVAALNYPMGFIGGYFISFVWWTNSRGAAHSDVRFGREFYAAGAACGTVFGMWLGR